MANNGTLPTKKPTHCRISRMMALGREWAKNAAQVVTMLMRAKKTPVQPSAFIIKLAMVLLRGENNGVFLKSQNTNESATRA